MKTIVILLLITLSFAYFPEGSFLEPYYQDTVPVIPQIAQEATIEEPIEQAPNLERQDAILLPLPLNDLADSSVLESASDSDAFQVDQTYFFGPSSSFTDIYNEWNKENLANEPEKTEIVEVEEVADNNSVKEGFEKIGIALEGVFNEVMVALKELSKEAKEENSEKITDETIVEPVEPVELDDQDENNESSDSDFSSTDGDDIDNTYFNGLDYSDESLSDDVVNLDEVLLASGNLPNETFEEKAPFNIPIDGDVVDLDNSYSNGLGVEQIQEPAGVEFDFDKVYAAFRGLTSKVIERQKLFSK